MAPLSGTTVQAHFISHLATAPVKLSHQDCLPGCFTSNSSHLVSSPSSVRWGCRSARSDFHIHSITPVSGRSCASETLISRQLGSCQRCGPHFVLWFQTDVVQAGSVHHGFVDQQQVRGGHLPKSRHVSVEDKPWAACIFRLRRFLSYRTDFKLFLGHVVLHCVFGLLISREYFIFSAGASVVSFSLGS